MPELSIVIPAFNEEANIREMISDVIQTMNDLALGNEIIVVDDGSSDRTAEIVNEIIQTRPAKITLMRHDKNQGYGAAVFTGITNARKEYIFYADADRQFDLNEIGKLLALIDAADMIVGYRSPRRDPFMRKLNGWGWSIIVTLLFGYTARDIDCAFKLIRREVVNDIKDVVRSRGATFSAEFLVRAKRAGYKIVEVAIKGHRPRVAGNPTGANLGVIIRAFRELFRFRLRLLRETMGSK